MEAHWIEWLGLLGRWIHFITGVAWIGASFYFIWLDNHLLPVRDPADTEKGIGGEVWSVHGGGFYHAQKYLVAPQTLPEPLHWFKWEAYSTWLSGMFLLVLIYWYGAELYLIDPNVLDLTKPAAIGISAGVIVIGWLVYDGLCRSPLANKEQHLNAVIFVLALLSAYGLCQVFSGRGAYIHYGAVLGTIMVANVFFIIIPGQRQLVTAKLAGRPPDPEVGLRGKQRSVHNTYFTLPVLFVMISNHHAGTYAHPYNWAILIGLSIAGALIRVYFVARHRGRASPIPAVAAGLIFAAIFTALAPTEQRRPLQTATLEQAAEIIQLRCVSCHSAVPTQAGFSSPPKGFAFDTLAEVTNHATAIYQQTVQTKAMPIGNLTQMTAAERTVIDHWYATFSSGANRPSDEGESQ